MRVGARGAKRSPKEGEKQLSARDAEFLRYAYTQDSPGMYRNLAEGVADFLELRIKTLGDLHLADQQGGGRLHQAWRAGNTFFSKKTKPQGKFDFDERYPSNEEKETFLLGLQRGFARMSDEAVDGDPSRIITSIRGRVEGLRSVFGNTDVKKLLQDVHRQQVFAETQRRSPVDTIAKTRAEVDRGGQVLEKGKQAFVGPFMQANPVSSLGRWIYAIAKAKQALDAPRTMGEYPQAMRHELANILATPGQSPQAQNVMKELAEYLGAQGGQEFQPTQLPGGLAGLINMFNVHPALVGGRFGGQLGAMLAQDPYQSPDTQLIPTFQR